MFNLPLLQKYRILNYQTSSGRDEIDIFASKLDVKSRNKIKNTIRLLEGQGLRLLYSNFCKKIHKKPSLFELRIKTDVQIRILFFEPQKNTFMLLNIFVKKKQKTPKNEIETALKRMREVVSNLV